MLTRLRACRTVAAALMAIGLAGCATNPATGKVVPVGMTGSAAEKQAGREQHPEVLEAFGGSYDNPALQSYVNEVGQRVAAQSKRKGIAYTFTVLDTPIVNALAIPGGYIYVTRGLLALVNDESELAGVLGHEVGHVAAMHHAQARARQKLGAVGMTAGSIAMGRTPLTRVTQVAAVGYLQAFSREDEYEADALGIRYAARAGYDPRSMATFLASLREYTRLEAIEDGRSPDSTDEFDYMATHPTAIDRFQRALEEASNQIPAQPIVGRRPYFAKIDGLLYGDSPAQGFVRGRARICGRPFEIAHSIRRNRREDGDGDDRISEAGLGQGRRSDGSEEGAGWRSRSGHRNHDGFDAARTDEYPAGRNPHRRRTYIPLPFRVASQHHRPAHSHVRADDGELPGSDGGTGGRA